MRDSHNDAAKRGPSDLNQRASARAGSKRDFIDTFVAPRPKPWLIAALVPVNRVLCLAGIPGLRRVPGLNCIPGVRGIADVVRIDFPEADRARMKAAVNAQTAAFIAPNHPEFFTDWMLDKEICTRIAPLTANWATHTIVNGMGPTMQRFWLANNLIAQIPGSRGAAGKAHSVEWAAQGHAVLLHPEGQVGWHGDYIGPLFGGVVEMAVDTLARVRELGTKRDVVIAPIVWKLRFERDERRALAREMRYVERKLGLDADLNTDLAQRVYRVYRSLLQRDAREWRVVVSASEDYWITQARVLAAMAQQLTAFPVLNALPLPATTSDAQATTLAYVGLLSNADRTLRSLAADEVPHDARRLIKDMRRLLRLRREMYPSERLTQEHLAEHIKRLRNDYCYGSWRDNLNRFMPQPAGSRVAILRVPPPLNVSTMFTGSEPSESLQAKLLLELRARMQYALDGIANEGNSVVDFANPFRDGN